MLKAIIILSLVALLSAAPADDKQTLSRPSPINPDVVSDPKPKDNIHTVDDGHHHSHPEHVKLQPADVNGGATAHPLHKRESPVAAQKPVAPQPNLANGQKTQPQVNAPKAQVNGQQRPVNNNQKPRQQANNNQKSGQTQTQTNNQQKQVVNAQQPIPAQKTPQQPISNSRVTRDAPKVAEQKPAAPETHANDAHKTQPKEAPKPRQQVNNQQKPVVNAQQPISAQKTQQPISNSRVTRDAPKVAEQKPAVPQTHASDAHKTQPKEAPKPRQQANNNQKSGQTQVNNQQKPVVNAQQPISAQKTQQPISNSRVTRDAPKVAEQKPAAPQVHANDAHKTQPKEAPKPRQQVNNQQKPVVNAQQPISAQKTQQPISNSRVTRDAPKVAEQKPAVPQTHASDAHKTQPKEAPKPRQQANNNQKSGQTQVNNQQKPVVNAQQPISAQKTQQPISNSRVTRDAPKVAEQKPAAPQVHANDAHKTQPKEAPKPRQQANNNQKSGQTQVNNQQKPVVNAQQPIAAQKTQQPIYNSRVTRDAPRVAEQKPAVPQSNVNDAKKDLPTSAPAHVHPNNHKAAQDSTVHKSAPQQPITPQKQPITNARVRRGAPNPVEQSKIVPSGHQTAEVTTESNGFKTGLFKIESITTPSPSNVAHKELSADEKKVQSAAAQHTSEHTQALPVHKREAQSAPTNVREPISSQSYDSYGNQAPSYVHPKPISEVLKKQPKAAHHHEDHEDTESEKESPVTKEADPVTSKPTKSS